MNVHGSLVPSPFSFLGSRKACWLAGAIGREGKRGTEGTGRVETKAGDGQGGKGKEEREDSQTARRPPAGITHGGQPHLLG